MDRRCDQLDHFPHCRLHVSRIGIFIPRVLTESGAFIVDPLNKYLGRRGEIFLTAIILTATPIGSGFTQTWQQLFAVRFIMGIGIGAKNATVPIFSAELAPARIRGALVMFWQLWVVAGIFLGFCANVIVKDTGAIAWRLQLGSAFIPAFILMIGIYFTPESPRWLMKKGKYDKAFRSFLKLRAHPIIAARDYYYSHVIYQEELAVSQGSNYFSRLWDCFRVPRIRRANYGASTVMIAQQMCGINSECLFCARSKTTWGMRVVCKPCGKLRHTDSANLSHFVLLFDYFRQRRLHTHTSSVRISRLRSRPSRLHYPHLVPHRHCRPTKALSHHLPWNVYIPTRCGSFASQRLGKQSRPNWTRRALRLPLHHLLLAW